MQIRSAPFQPDTLATEALVLPLHEGGMFSAAALALDGVAGGTIAALQRVGDFKGKLRETVILYTPALGAKRLALAGLGKPGKLTLEKLRNAVGEAVTTLRDRGVKSLAIALPAPAELGWQGPAPTAEELVQAIAEAAQLVLYQMNEYRTTDQEELKLVDEIVLLTPPGMDAGALKQGIDAAHVLVESIAIARTLILHPGDVLPPAKLGEEAQRIGREAGLDVKVLDHQELARRGFGGLLGIGQGSEQPACFIELAWHGGPPGEAPVAVVGKGITFDTGGIGIKPGPGMERMKYDMAGGAATIAILRAAALLKLPLNVVGLVPAAENMPSATAIKPGDIVTSYKGLTIEVNDTDAEGRVVLADALAYAVKDSKAQAIIDMATLTGAVGVALGKEVCGVMGNHQPLLDRLLLAGEKAGERGWQLPLWEEFDEFLESDIADLKNYGGRYAGAIAAGSFLQQFVDDTPWVHLDIAGSGWSDADRGYRPKGPTGAPVRTVVELLRRWQPLERTP